jgi:hypothetical protein
MAVMDQKDSVRLKLEFDGGIENNRQVVKSKIYTKIKPNAASEDLYQVARFNLLKSKREVNLWKNQY